MRAVKVGQQGCYGVYPPGWNPLWEQWSTRVKLHKLEVLFENIWLSSKGHLGSRKQQGMEYPWFVELRSSRTRRKYSDRVKFGMMIKRYPWGRTQLFPWLNLTSASGQDGWRFKLLCTVRAEQDFGETHPDAIPGLDATHHVADRLQTLPYMGGDQHISPIMSKGLNVYQVWSLRYGNQEQALNIYDTVRSSLIKSNYSNRWCLSTQLLRFLLERWRTHSAADLDWFWEVGSTPQFNDMGNSRSSVSTLLVSGEMKKIHWRKQNSRWPLTFISIYEKRRGDLASAWVWGVLHQWKPTLKEYLMKTYRASVAMKIT
jgi:hypothetical protein